jgi:hypothetical protein
VAGTKITTVLYEPTDPRLGRHVEHDERSRNFAFMAATARPKKINTLWTSQAPVLDQGQLGSCTGNAMAQWLNTDFATPARARKNGNLFLDEQDALDIYSKATALDKVSGIYPPMDTGSTGNAAAKAATKFGWIDSYGWLFSFQSAQAAVEKTPLLAGTLWTNNMFDDPVNGLMKVGSLADSNIAGGHEYVWPGIDWTEEVVIFRQSWGENLPGYKPGGYFAISFVDFRRLLGADGDVTVPHWK